jgi:hypothetical protein
MPDAPSESLADLLPLTPDGRAERLAVLKRLFPDLFTNEGRLNPDELRLLAEPNEVHESERYEFKWYGKAASKREAFTPTSATLVYDPQRSVNPDQADGNMIIEGENLESLKLLLNAYREQVTPSQHRPRVPRPPPHRPRLPGLERIHPRPHHPPPPRTLRLPRPPLLPLPRTLPHHHHQMEPQTLPRRPVQCGVMSTSALSAYLLVS